MYLLPAKYLFSLLMFMQLASLLARVPGPAPMVSGGWSLRTAPVDNPAQHEEISTQKAAQCSIWIVLFLNPCWVTIVQRWYTDVVPFRTDHVRHMENIFQRLGNGMLHMKGSSA